MNVFAFDNQAVRVVMEGGEPWFVGKDVAVVLGYARPSDALQQHCKGAVKRRPLQTAGGMQDVRIISEPDMLRLIVGSKLPAADRFERWVFEEVLPSIRKTGSYVHPQAPGALGACVQPLPQALPRANAITQAQTGMDVLAMLNADDHLLALEAQARMQARPASGRSGWRAASTDCLTRRV
jgi:prophage antirepressor-like protein